MRVKPSHGRVLTALIAWVAGAATAVAVGLFALSSIDFGLANRSTAQPLGEPQSAAPSAEPSQSPTADPPSAPPGGIERIITSDGGSVVARCTPAGAYLVSWSPAQGFRSDDVRRGPAASARVAFERPGRKYVITVKCVGGMPQGSVSRHE